MPHDFKPLSMFWDVTASKTAFVHNSTSPALLLHCLCRSLNKRGQAPFFQSRPGLVILVFMLLLRIPLLFCR